MTKFRWANVRSNRDMINSPSSPLLGDRQFDPDPYDGNTSLVSQNPPAAEPRFALARFLQLLRERIWLVILISLIFGVLGAIWAKLLPDIYEGRATLLVEAPLKKNLGVQERVFESPDNQSQLNTLAQSIRNTAVLERVVRTNRLTEDRRFTTSEVPLTPDAAIGRLRNMLVTKLRPNTRLIDITVRGTNAAITSILARSVALEFIAYREARDVETTRTSANTLEGEAIRLREKADAAEKASQEFREKNEIISLKNGSELLAQTLTRLNTELNKARDTLEALNSDLALLKVAGNDVEKLLLVRSIANDSAVKEMRSQVIAQELILVGYTNRYKPAHPKRIAAEKLLANQRESLLQLAHQAGRSVEVDIAVLKAQIQRNETERSQAELEAKRIARLAGTYNELEQEFQTDTTMLQDVLKRIKELDLTSRVESIPMSLAETSNNSGRPVGPQRRMLILGFAGVGFILGIGILYGQQRFDSSLRTVDEVEERLKLPILGAVALHSSTAANKEGVNGSSAAHLMTLEDPTCITAEGFRSLRTTVTHLGRNDEVKIQLFASALPGEGKSFCAMNHAVTLANAGHRVVLIDLDLRRPVVGSRLKIPADAPGVSSFLLGEMTFAQIQNTSVPGLTVIPAGPRIPNPAEQLARPYLGELLRQAAAQFDYVVLDSAPVNPVSDTLSFARLAQVVLLVIQAGKTQERVVRKALLELRRAGNPARGIVLNCLPRRSGHGYYYYYYSDDGYYSDAASNGKAKGKKKKGKG